jgi:hypothetical protein
MNTELTNEVEIQAWSPPATARVPEGSSYFWGEDDGYCRVIHADGRRCQGVRTLADGLCPPHAGKSKILDDPRGMQARSAQGRVRARERRAVLAANGVNPRMAAREAAIRRSEDVVRALVDEPLDDRGLSTMQRQRAVLGMLDAVFPLAHTEVEVEIPSDPESLSWSDMQRLAAQLSASPQD